MNKLLLQLDCVCLKRNNSLLLSNIDLELYSGEIITLVGPNGAGKTSLAKVALNIISPDKGRVKRKDGITIGYVPQKISLDWTMPITIQRMLSLSKKNTITDINKALQTVGIERLADAQIQNLSGGELQRAFLARAIINKPDLLVLDEPVQGVDFSSKVMLYDLIATIRKQTGCGVLLISHDLNIVATTTDRVICMNGHICCQGTPESIAKHPEYVQLFGSSAESIAIYRHDHSHDHSHAKH